MRLAQSGALTGFSFYFLSRSILYMLPSVIGMCLPLASLLALLLSLGQMSQDGEIVALRAGGYSFFNIFSWVFASSALLALLLVFINNFAGPYCASRSTDYARIMLQRISRINLKPNTFQKISDWALYADDVNGITGEMTGVKLFQRTNKGNTSSVVTMNASSGWYRSVYDKGMLVQLYDGQFTQTDNSRVDKLIYGSFSSYETVLQFFSEGEVKKTNYREMTTTELKKLIDNAKTDKKDKSDFRTEALSRTVLALGPIVFFLIGAPLGVALDKRGKSAGFVLSLVILFFYYGFTIGSLILARKNELFYPWAVWAPTALGLLGGAWLWKKRLSGR